MEIRTIPYNLHKIDSINCNCCNFILQKIISKGQYLIVECGYCRYSDRAFATYSSSWQQHYPNGCTCTYGEKDFLYISCENCNSPTCIKCKNVSKCCNTNCSSLICSTCIEKNKFSNNWKSSTPKEKLNFYGIEKLKILAKYKNIKGYSKHKKNELIKILSDLVNNDDFPIH